MKENKRIKKSISPFLLVIISFVVIIAIGSILMTTPWANKNGQWRSYIDCLLVATSGTCVTGLCSLENGVGNDFTFFGQLVLLICIQFGGLGFVTIFSFVVTLFKRKMEFKDRLFLSMAVGASSLSDLSKFVRKIILISLGFEVFGFLISLPVFFELYPNSPANALWCSCFHSISTFNNAGFDILGSSSFVRGCGSLVDQLSTPMYVYLLIVTMVLIVCGGLSFLTFIDIFSFKKFKKLKSYTKICLMMAASLLLFGFVCFLLTDGFKGNDAMSPLDCIFQSVTLRTAGYASYNQASISIPGRIVSCFLMFIGGSPISTAGGIKTTTIFIIILAIFKYMRGKEVIAFNRKYSQKMILKTMAIVFLALSTIIIGVIALSAFEIARGMKIEDLTYEAFSAFGTVGVTTGITSQLTIGSKIVLCVLMFLGRLGPVTIFQVYQKNMNSDENPHIHYVEDEIAIG